MIKKPRRFRASDRPTCWAHSTRIDNTDSKGRMLGEKVCQLMQIRTRLIYLVAEDVADYRYCLSKKFLTAMQLGAMAG